jgi:hypothetical protein
VHAFASLAGVGSGLLLQARDQSPRAARNRRIRARFGDWAVAGAVQAPGRMS